MCGPMEMVGELCGPFHDDRYCWLTKSLLRKIDTTELFEILTPYTQGLALWWFVTAEIE